MQLVAHKYRLTGGQTIIPPSKLGDNGVSLNMMTMIYDRDPPSSFQNAHGFNFKDTFLAKKMLPSCYLDRTIRIGASDRNGI
jgi:hypothetical protein